MLYFFHYQFNIRKGKSQIKDKKGTTMVTVVISFALLMILVTTFYGVQKISQNMLMNTKDMIVNSRELLKAYYLDETENEIVADNVRLSFEYLGQIVAISLLLASKVDTSSSIIGLFSRFCATALPPGMIKN